MRAALGPVFAVFVCASRVSLDAQLVTQTQDVQQRLEDFALLKAEELALLSASSAGSLHPSAEASFRRLGEAVRLWKREKNSGAAPLLAEGVLLDCLSRLTGVSVRPLPGERGVPVATGYAAQRKDAAATAFETALRLQPDLTEARMRRARLKAAGDSSAVRQLEAIAADQAAMPFSYLAAVSRASLAHTRRDHAVAVRWYERALELKPRSTAATIALSTLKPATALPFDTLENDDLYYTYPCTVLTPDVAASLSERVQRAVVK